MADAAQLQVLIARTADEVRAIRQLRYRVEVEGLGRTPAFADRETKRIDDPADRGALHVYLTHSGRVAAAVRILVASVRDVPALTRDRLSMSAFDDMADLTLSITEHLVVDPDIDDSRMMRLLMTAAYKIATAKKSVFDFTHAAPGEIAMLERLGYRRLGDGFEDEAGGMRVPLVLPTGDLAHMVQVRSPYQSIARVLDHDPQPVNWFNRTFPEAIGSAQPASMDEDAFWSMLTRKLNQVPHHGVPLLVGLDFRDACKFLKLATVVACSEGQKIVAKGDVGNEMYVLLSGAVDVRDGERRVASFGRGAIFGEMAYLNAEPRTADVVAAEPSELLILTQENMQKIMETMPTIAARVLHNLSLILVERLRETTSRYVKLSNTKAAA
ncbi:MAG: cyclic nucleotide-binding domain-containing protein [Minwuia sp.]|nr:cyclic nucleotide-binding domain-containing protein [Minwuia sp.]